MSDENLTQPAQVDAPQLSAPTGDAAVIDPNSLTLEEINQATGKTFKTKEDALKSVTESIKLGGKAADVLGHTDKNQERLDAAELDAFLARNPQHEANLTLLQTLAKAEGVSLREATELPIYKETVEKMSEGGTSKRTIAAPNGRVASPAPTADVKDVLGDPDASAQFVVDNILKK